MKNDRSYKCLLHKIRGIYDFKALNERYKNIKIYNYHCPIHETKKNFEIIIA